MVLLKTAIHALKENLVANLFTALQLVASLLITVVMISSIMVRYTYYKPFRDVFQSQGLFCVFDMNAYDPNTIKSPCENLYLQNDDILRFLNGADKVIGCNTISLFLTDHEGQSINNYSYDDDLIQRYQPELKEGQWLNTSDQAEEIEVVISENCFGYGVGDTIPLSFYDTPESSNTEGRVVGILKDGAKIPGGYATRTGADTYNLFYMPYYCDIEEIPVVLLSSEYVASLKLEHPIHQGLFSTVLITYPDGTDASVIEEDQKTLAEMGCGVSISLEKMESDNRDYLLEQFYLLFPIVAVLLVLIIVSSVSSSALATKRRLKQYATFYILGLRWKNCAYINLLQSGLMTALSLVLFVVGVVVIQNTKLQEYVTILNCAEVWFGILEIVLLYLIISMIMPLLIIGRSTPKQILTK